MESNSQTKVVLRPKRRMWMVMTGLLLLALAVGIWVWRTQLATPNPKAKKVLVEQVVSAVVVQQDVPVTLTAKGTVSALQTVEVRAQISATVKEIGRAHV